MRCRMIGEEEMKRTLAYQTRSFWESVLDRCVRTGGQFGVSYLVVTLGQQATETGFNGLTLNYLELLGWVLGGVVVSLLTSLAFPGKLASQQTIE